MSFHEGKALDALLYRLEKRENASRRDVSSPDRERHHFPVDLKCRLGDQFLAIEHTGIEPFEKHIESDVRAGKFFDPIRRALFGRLPHDSDFELRVSAHAISKINLRAAEPVQLALINWIERTSPTLKINPPGRLLDGIRDIQPPGVPFEASLFRCSTIGNGRFDVIHTVKDVETLRFHRIKRAYDKKMKNLNAWKQTYGARSVLLLEENDIQLTNAEVVAKAIDKIVNGTTARPDEIHLVTTCTDTWWVTPIWNGRFCYYDETNPGDRFWEVDRQNLKSLTDR